MLASSRCESNRYLRCIEWTISRESGCPLQFIQSIVINACLNVVLAEKKMRRRKARIHFNNSSQRVRWAIEAKPNPGTNHEVEGVEFQGALCLG